MTPALRESSGNIALVTDWALIMLKEFKASSRPNTEKP
jgi:hypothetical protein